MKNSIIIVGGGLAGLSAAHQAYLRGANVVLLDKQGFLSGNSGKATSGINGALTRTQVNLLIKDSVEQFYQDTLATAKDRANPELIKVLTYNSADAIHWLQQIFDLDLTIVLRLGGHSQPRTHRGKDSKFPGMAITYKLLETLEHLAEAEPDRVQILKNCQVIDLLKEDDSKVIGVQYKDLQTKEKYELFGPVIMSTGGYAADFTKNSLLRKYRPDIIDLPLTNGVHATGDGHKIIMKNTGLGIDMDKVQVHPTGLINLNDKDTIAGKSTPRFLFLGAEALRGEGGIMLNNKGERFVDELGTRDHVSGEMEKQFKAGNGPIRLVLNEEAESRLEFHVKHYKLRELMKTLTGDELVAEFGLSDSLVLEKQLAEYNKAAKGDILDPYGKKFFPATPFVFKKESKYNVSYITRVLHFTMGGVKINDKSQVVHQGSDGNFQPFEGLYAAGELAGGIHGHNRLGGSSLLACVVFGRLAADEATSYFLHKLASADAPASNASATEMENASSGASERLGMIHLHIDPANPQKIVVEWDTKGLKQKEENKPDKAEEKPAPVEKASPKEKTAPFLIPDKEFTTEEVAKHNTATDCWVIVRNVVLDLTSFLEQHPGGKGSIMAYAGKDATESFEMLHEDNFIPKYVAQSVKGVIKGTKLQLAI